MKTGESKKLIESVLDHHSKFIATKIRSGGFEGVRVPYFGVFEAKLRSVQMMNFSKTLPKATEAKK